MYLSATELIELTGYRQPKRQIQWLLENNIRYLPNAGGRPRVLAAERDRVMIGHTMGRKTPSTIPNFEAING